MARIIYPTQIEAITGRDGKIVFVRKKLAEKAGVTPGGYYRRFVSGAATYPRQVNQRIGMKIVQQQYSLLMVDTVPYQTWIHQAATFTIQYGYNINSRVLFNAYYMAKYIGEMSNYVMPTALSDGVSWKWADAASRMWV